MKLFRLKLHNEASQRTMARFYFVLIFALAFRPDVGSLLPHLQELTNITPETINFFFLAVGVWLRRSQPIYILQYFVCLLPLALFSGYIVVFMFTNINSSIVTSTFILFAWFKIFEDLKQSLETLA